MNRKLRKVKGKKWVAGVCAGVAYWLGIPTWLARLVWTSLVIFAGFGLLLYVLLWIFMPVWPATPPDYEAVTGD